MPWRLLAVTLLLALNGCHSNLISRFKPASYDDAAYQVYSGLFSEKDTGITPGQLTIIQQETIPGSRIAAKDVSSCFPSDWSFRREYGSALADYNKQNKTPRELVRRFAIASPYQLVPERETISDSSGANPSDRFLERYPKSDGYIAVSAVGFNRGRTRAIVFAAHYGIFGDVERYYALEKRGERWTESHAGCTWLAEKMRIKKVRRAAPIP